MAQEFLLNHLNLAPPLVAAGASEDLATAGQTLYVSPSPGDNSMAVFLGPVCCPCIDPSKESSLLPASDQVPVYLCSADEVPVAERRLFITDTLVIFTAFRNLMETAASHEDGWLEQEEASTTMRKLAIDYVNFIKECWVHTSQVENPETPLQCSSDSYRALYTCFSLFVILYMPEYGLEDAPVGDEVMEWLNVHFVEPSTEEGDHLSRLERPWEDESFWAYIARTTIRGLTKATVFFLNVLSEHPSKDLQDVAQELIPVVESQPLLKNFDSESAFKRATNLWRDRVKLLRIDMNHVPESDRYDDFDNWWDRLSDILGVLEGRGDVLRRLCGELGADWKEVCAAWGLFVQPHLRRQDLADVALEVQDGLPPDSTSEEDMIHSALILGRVEEALQHCANLDVWLAAHLADLFLSLKMIDSDVNDESGLSKRDSYILSYAEYLHSDPTLWRITVDYMYSCGKIGTARADEVLLRVPLRLVESAQADGGKTQAGNVVGVVKDVNQTCYDYKRESVRRTVCKIAARTLVQENLYGLAVSYCISAEDWTGMGRVVDKMLEEYLQSGMERFVKSASTVSLSLQELAARSNAMGIFVQRLSFVVRYADFHRLRTKGELFEAADELVVLLRDEIAPRAWWAVLLCDATELLQYEQAFLFSQAGVSHLLQKSEEIRMRSAQGAEADYLDVLARSSKGGKAEALNRLRAVRLALARYIARCSILDNF
ncbi:hypothetical protein FISHEDRAFT_34385 [Fistulina hepatica ATCC 64428]|uniref:Nuclear pore complex protein Nup85 n=1 Tax=Fistulina hepatica ATCC 64428 TaxID=1128425 RepID=A0A0D7AN44_9AGAR|nr:hypothetical protein FISHEDRAFT_34385 [Fistulina hepatica ATCC 64428]